MQSNAKLKASPILKLGEKSLPLIPHQAPKLTDPFLNKLIHVASHDLRSPLFVIRSYAQLLQKTQEKNRLERGFKQISDATYKMESTINALVQLVDIYTMPAPNATLTYFEAALAQAKFQLHNELVTHQAEITSNFTACPEVSFPENFLTEILFQLLANAMNHNPEKENLSINVKTYQVASNSILEISDNGAGIALPQDELHKVTQPFYTLSDNNKCIGMGLSKIQAIAKIFGGTFELKNTIGKGVIARFHF